MGRRFVPEIGCWYEDLDQNTLFEVVSIDDDEGSIGIQYFDGDIEELDWETFSGMRLQAIEQPEDWSGPYEFEMDGDDSGETQDYPANADYLNSHSDYNDSNYPYDDFIVR